MPTFTKQDLGITLGAIVGIVIAKRYVRPVIKGAM